MPSELTLFFSDDRGQEQEISVRANPFTIGRQEGNELVIPDASLSRRHALITMFNDVAQLSDCGSQNGTFLNGKPLSGNAVLQNGDVITVGHSCQLRVRLTEKAAAPVAPPPVALPKAAPPVSQPAPPPPATNQAESLSLSPTMLALLATGAIVLIAGVLILVVALRKPKPMVKQDDIVFAASTATATPSESTATAASATTTSTSDQLETSLRQVIRNISNDQSYPFAPAVLDAVRSKATQFATPTLANSLRAIAARSREAGDQIRAQGLQPALLVFMALADTNGGQAGDPLAVARQAMEEVQFLRGHFGSDFADQTLLVVAAYKIPGGSKKSHPLLPVLNRLVRNPQTDRNVWFLRDKGALSDAAYDFVLRFLAYGAIAQNPRQFGLDAPALIF